MLVNNGRIEQRGHGCEQCLLLLRPVSLHHYLARDCFLIMRPFYQTVVQCSESRSQGRAKLINLVVAMEASTCYSAPEAVRRVEGAFSVVHS